MLTALALKEMTLEEKFMTIEAVWDNIIHNSPDFQSPSWHKDVLQDRELKIQSGEDQLIDWKSAKQSLRESLE